jgi:hypothetical protein
VAAAQGGGHGKEVVPMCHEFDSQFFRARALEALRRKVTAKAERKTPAAAVPSATPTQAAAIAAKPQTIPA